LRFLVSLFMVLCLAVTMPLDAQAAPKKKSNSPNNKYASIVMDAETGTIISERHADKVLYPASLTKVMTLLLLFEAMENGNVRLNDKIYISQRAANQAPSKIGLLAGSSIRVEDAILALVTKSANDISVAIAEHLAGTENRFAQRMTQRAHSIGMTKTRFKNAHGLPNPDQVSSARDMATLARYVITRYPNYYRYFSTKQFTYRGVTYTNHNRLMQTYPGMDGFKTGYINASGFNLIASARRSDRRLIGVVFGGRTTASRNDHMAELLNAGFTRMGDVRYANRQPVPVAPTPEQAVAAVIPVPPQKPVIAEIPMELAQAPTAVEVQKTASYTSLDSLTTRTQIIVPVTTDNNITAEAPINVTEDAIATVTSDINNGMYSEVTGQGDFDAATTRRVEAGLLAAAVYKGDKKVKAIKASAASRNQVLDAPQNLAQQLQEKEGVQQAVYAPAPVALPSPSQLWSVQIGAYNSRIATDEALRRAASKLPSELSHATPIVVPLATDEGTLFRGRLGNFTKAQANDACRYFRDCLPVAPR
jgi:D-alanyl-D-alanine carboxypeptidase